MKNLIKLLILTLLVVLSSCEEDKLIYPEILYRDISPDISLTTFYSIDYLKKNPSPNFSTTYGGGIKIINSDTIYRQAYTTDIFDMDGNNKPDFSFTVEHNFASPNENDYDEFLIIIRCPSLNHEVSLSDKTNGYVKKYQLGESIVESTFNFNFYNLEGVYYFDRPGAYIYVKNNKNNFENIGDYYLAVKFKKNEKDYYGWIHVESSFLNLKIKECAISTIPNKKIKIGQTN
ncbi:hypothetical protein [Wenyingzhuangia marina]|uniref:Uncharacterized protein n=1 Tax=Wenyingzhuangia marina TaxID=1195760 RepID=A0A1M5U578_9FLAO|nr:hypothetical protein [Wenyingzhuangia marina]GGF69531.1 hypothetical protein GCM10011397_10580 [Wenyingzhuangia marina]SHH58098.1 hypothetical protein SAMN05444281_1039 [Wenyingzhuangia marina]